MLLFERPLPTKRPSPGMVYSGAIQASTFQMLFAKNIDVLCAVRKRMTMHMYESSLRVC